MKDKRQKTKETRIGVLFSWEERLKGKMVQVRKGSIASDPGLTIDIENK
jgi:hypothetical protein